MQIDLSSSLLDERARQMVLEQSVQILRQYGHLSAPDLVTQVCERTGHEALQVRDVLMRAAASREPVLMPKVALF